MPHELRVALIGLDTSHTIEFARRMQAPDCPADQKVDGLRATTCLRFPTPFQNEEGLDKRQAQLEAWGVTVTSDFSAAVAACDVIMVEINDPAFHLAYFEKVAALGKPVFLDKPLADTIASGQAIVDLARRHHTRVCSGSSLRFVPELEQACAAVAQPTAAWCCGPLGQAPAGSGIIWYGVHAFEMLQRAMGIGAESLQAVPTGNGLVNVIQYAGGRHGDECGRPGEDRQDGGADLDPLGLGQLDLGPVDPVGAAVHLHPGQQAQKPARG